MRSAVSMRTPWICPKCSRTLGVANQEHVCELHDLSSHFDGRDPLGSAVFDWICDAFQSLGPHDVLPMKTMIAFACGVNLAMLKTKRSGAEIWLVLASRPASSRVSGVVPYSKTKAIYRVPIRKASDLDEELRGWICDAYALRALPP